MEINLEELIKSIDIVEYIGQFVELNESNGEFWGLSPFREERTPSFSVRTDPPFFYDFSSGKSGNIYTFIKEYFNCSGREAVEKIKEYAGADSVKLVSSMRLSAVSECKKFKRSEPSKKVISAPAKIQNNVMDKYYWDDDKMNIWRREGIGDDSLHRFNVKYDPFANRLVYPIYNLAGSIVNIGGRTLDKDFKERGLSKYCYYYKWGGAMDVIFGLYDNLEYIKKAKEIILFEGCKSVLIADGWNIKNCGAILTSHLSPNQLRILAKLGCKVVFALDKDVNIFNDKNINKLKQYVNVSYIYDRRNLLEDKDSPVDKGEEVFRTLYDERFRYR